MSMNANTSAIDWSSYASVERNYLKLGGTPTLRGTRMPAQAVIDNHLDGLSPEEIADIFELPLTTVRAFLTDAVARN